MWKFTKHVLIRISKRGYTRDELLMVLNGDVPAIVYPSPKEDTVGLYFGRVWKKNLMIPVYRTTQSIITVRPMRKKEKEIFLKEIDHE